ncbi:MAG: thiamine biosynthesis protein ThiF [Pseudonocardiales bacterium]|nr:MAG: thiamine biosynthesis protein ThiF [Pseudonocardiales bacterium]
MRSQSTATGTRVIELRVRAADWLALQQHLFPGDGDEHGAALLCGSTTERGRLRLLVREVVLAVDGVDYVVGTRGYRLLTGEFVSRQLRRAKDAGLVYLAAHNHGGDRQVSFSGADLASHERGYPTLLAVNGAPVGGLVLARTALAGDIWLTDGTRHPVDRTVVVSDALLQLSDGQQRTFRDSRVVGERYSRQTLAFGEEGQARLGQLKVAVVGAGGVGMLVVQLLARLGVGEFVIVDPDHVSRSNLSRLPECRLHDATGRFGDGWFGRLAGRFGLNAPTPKVELARRIVRGANPTAVVTPVPGDIADDDIAKKLIGCDFVFLAADTMLARDVVNQIAYQYLIPTLQIGSKVVVDPKSGAVRDVFGVVRSLGTYPGCLRCNDLVNVTKLAEEAVATAEQRRNQRYVDDPDISAPSVITLNAMAVGWAVNDFMHYASGIGRPSTGFRVIRSKPVGTGQPQFIVQDPHIDADCHVCSTKPYSALAVGDGRELPTRTG